MLNREIYTVAPQDNRLVNNGVAEVSEDFSEAAQRTLRYELETFVCDGQYEKGLETILDKFLLNLGNKSEQPGVWISGFYGSGKSHLAKMLRILWTDFKFTDGATARQLANLPSQITDALRELSTAGARNCGLHAAAGKLGAGAGDNVRLALLGVIFKSTGLPEQYNQAQFVRWLKRENLYDQVAAELEAGGRTLAASLTDMYVSSHLGKALLKARPGFADSETAARQLIKAQFPQAADVTNEQMVAAITDALTANGAFPLTVVVLDEVQQFIGTDADKAYKVQEVTESLCKHFSGKLLFVGTGQSALTGTPSLQRIRGRFPVEVMLGDWDVENVTRKIILGKKPSAQAPLVDICKKNLGEISRHLQGTKLQHVTEDESYLVTDYPLLPVRRRFWERVLRTIDTTGTVSQLRSQLRVVHEAVLATADQQLGHVVAGDFLYDQIAANLLSTAQLPQEVFNNVAKFSAGNANEQLKARLLKLIYLINKLPTEVAQDIGLHATDNVLADLLVTDLAAGSTNLRSALPALLDELQNKDRLIMSLAGATGMEYRLQTRESSTWYDEYRAQEAELKAAPQRVEVQRAEMLKTRFRETLAKVRVTQGKANEARPLTPVFDETLPKDNAKQLYAWIQDGWQNNEKSVIAEAKAKGADNPTLFVFLREQYKTDIYAAIVALEAAKSTLIKRGSPTTEEGRDAQRAMESRQRTAQKELADLMEKLFADVRVFQAGGQEVTEGNELADRIARAAKNAVVRLYPEFDTADHDKWDKVVEESRKGNLEAMRAVGHTQEIEKHPVCVKISAFIGPGKKGADIRDNFEAPPYGWSRDAIDGALYALVASGHLRATDASGKAVDAKSLERAKLTQASFRLESVTITAPQKIKIRGVFTALGIACQPGEELNRIPQLLSKLRDLAKSAGGIAPAPAAPSIAAIEAIEAQSGNAQLLEVFSCADELPALAEQWKKVAASVEAKLPPWHTLLGLLDHAKELAPYGGLKSEADAILSHRTLLAAPDPVQPLLDQATQLLRDALNAKRKAYETEFDHQFAQLQANPDWRKLTEDQQKKLIAEHHLEKLQPVQLASAAQIQDALDECNLQHWISRTQALSSRFDAARHAAVQLLKPNVIHVPLPKRTLNNQPELVDWLSEVEKLLSEALKKGPVSL